MKLIEYADAEMMAIDLAQVLAGDLNNVLVHEERATLCVPGGTTPGETFDCLCAADLDWDRVDVMLTDERWLPEVHLRSNTRLVKEHLLQGRAAAARYHPLYIKAESPEDVLAEIEAGIVPILPVSVLLLGMGTDMHTASLIPGGDNLDLALSADAPLLVQMNAPGMPDPRVTLSARVLRDAVSTHLVITGTPKRNALERAMHLTPDEAPIAALLDDCTVHWAP